MKVGDVMTKDCRFCAPDDPVVEIAKLMQRDDVGAVPVGRDDKLVGMVTDRDIVVRGIAPGHALDRLTAETVMSEPVLYCYEDEDCESAARSMAERQVRRLPVVDRDKRLRGVVSVGDLARAGEAAAAGRAETGIAAA